MAPGSAEKKSTQEFLLPNLFGVVSYQDRPRVLRVLRGELVEPPWGVLTTAKILAEDS